MTARDLATAGLERAAAAAAERGVTVPPLSGKLLRPQTALAFVPGGGEDGLDDRFWLGCLAVQMAHEASLQHDDVIDGGRGRRSRDTVMAAEGAGAALLKGDLYLAGSYRVARMTGSDGFLDDYVEAVEATVRGECLQAGLKDRPGLPGYEAAVRAKSGALFGAAAALGSRVGVAGAGTARGRSAERLRDLGAEVGAFYQMVDDFLDYCPSARTGKPKLQDFRNRVWTFVLDDADPDWFDRSPDEAVAAFLHEGGESSLAGRALRRVGARRVWLEDALADAGARVELIAMVRGWHERCRKAVESDASGSARLPAGHALNADARDRMPGPSLPSAAALVEARARALGHPREWRRFFARNSRSFSFASALFPAEERRAVRGIYAFCRFTDDLVDQSRDSAPRTHELLDAWIEIARAAYEGRLTDVPLADVVMGDAARRRIPFSLATELVKGVRMDVEPRDYATMEELRRYTHRVASVVGAWMTMAFGVRDPWVIDRAHELGHAMQLTNIVRDVGEDLDMGRLYLPLDRMRRHGITVDGLRSGRQALLNGAAADAGVRAAETGAGAFLGAGYRDLLEELMSKADAAYAAAYEAMPALPTGFRRAVAVAAQVYRGIHGEVRANGYNNLTLRAHTSLPRKFALGRQGLGRLRFASVRPELAGAG